MWSDEIVLIGIVPFSAGEPEKDASGFPLPQKENRTLAYANRKSVGYREFYQAQQAGYSTEIKFEIYAEEYSGQSLVEHMGKRYKVLRSYTNPKTPDLTELTLSDLSERME